MKAGYSMAFLALSLFLAGCGHSEQEKPAVAGAPSKPNKPDASAHDDEAAIQASLAKLSKDDRADAELQRFCCIHRDQRLGAMGPPVKITLKDKDDEVTAFLCCKACEKAARKDEAKTVAVVQELNIQGNIAKLSPEDRKLATLQKYCASDGKSPLGSMGIPGKYIIKDKDGVEHPVFVCCGGCIATIKMDEAKTLQLVEELRKKNAAPK
jgi:hypothetical protein